MVAVATIWGSFPEGKPQKGQRASLIHPWRRIPLGRLKTTEVFRTIWGDVDMRCTGPIWRNAKPKWKVKGGPYYTIWGSFGKGAGGDRPRQPKESLLFVRTIWGKVHFVILTRCTKEPLVREDGYRRAFFHPRRVAVEHDRSGAFENLVRAQEEAISMIE